MTGDIRGDVRVAVAVAAHPGGETHRHKIHRQFVIEMRFQLFVQLAQIIRYAFPEAVFHDGEAPLGLVYRAWAVFANFVGVPGLRDKLAQATHDLVALVIGDIFVVELF